MRREDGWLEGAGGARIAWRAWHPDGAVRGHVVVAHGAHEHGERYARLAARLGRDGLATWAPDHRGHGRSDGARGVVDRFDDAVADLQQLVERASGAPVVVLGHSMGGALATLHALAHQGALAGLALSAPAVGAERPVPGALRRVVGAAAALRPSLPVHRLDKQAVSRDPDEVAAYLADPLVDQAPMRARTVAQLLDAFARIERGAPSLRLPLLVMVPTADRLAPPAAMRALHDRAGSADKTLLEYDGFFHELLNEPAPDRDRVADDLAAWVLARV